MLSDYELERLRNPKTDEDKQILKALPAETRKKIKQGSFNRDGLSMELDPDRLLYSFIKNKITNLLLFRLAFQCLMI